MAEKKIKRTKVRYCGRFAQIPIYIGKNFRMFVFQNDWKVIPMAAFISALVSMVVRNRFFLTMEGTAMGALAVTSVALWNGCFNSIQVVCRERAIIKREHRSGMYIFSYVISHMVYQAFLCLLQTVTMMVIFKYTGIKFPKHGVVVDNFLIEIGITIFMITYAADMMSLFISSVVKNSTSAMTVMPLILMIQLVFSGGLFSLPDNMQGLTKFMISNQGISCISAEARYNELPTKSSWNMIRRIASSPDADDELKATIIGLEMQGYDKQINEEARKANYKSDYKSTNENIRVRWEILGLFAFVFAVASMIALLFVDKDRR